jgi:hypothetical protein
VAEQTNGAIERQTGACALWQAERTVTGAASNCYGHGWDKLAGIRARMRDHVDTRAMSCNEVGTRRELSGVPPELLQDRQPPARLHATIRVRRPVGA